MMNKNDRYECNHLPSEELQVVQKYNSKQFVLMSKTTGVKYMVEVGNFKEPHLCLAHISDENCILRKIHKGLM